MFGKVLLADDLHPEQCVGNDPDKNTADGIKGHSLHKCRKTYIIFGPGVNKLK